MGEVWGAAEFCFGDLEADDFSRYGKRAHVGELVGKLFFGGGVIFGAPVEGAEVVVVPSDTTVGSVDDLEGDKFGFVCGVEGDVGEVVVVATGGDEGLGAHVLFDLAGLGDDFAAGFGLREFSAGEVGDWEDGGEPGPIGGGFGAAGFFVLV